MTRALLVIDVQREYFDGAFPVSYPSGHLDAILKVMDAASSAGVPVVVIRHHQPDPDSPVFRLHSEMWQLHPEIERRDHSVLIDKQWPGSFTGTQLEDWLRQHKIDTLTISGYMTQMCCDTTARQAFHKGYKVEFLSDATGTLTVENKAGVAAAEDLHRCTLVAQQMFISDVIESAEWISRIVSRG